MIYYIYRINKSIAGGEWITVGRRKKLKQNRFIGRKGQAEVEENCKFKAADAKIPLYIYNVSKETQAENIRDYIMDRTNIVVQLEKVVMKEEKDYDSYKILVPKQKLSLFEKDDLWPSDIYFRKFIKFRHFENRASYKTDSREKSYHSNKDGDTRN